MANNISNRFYIFSNKKNDAFLNIIKVGSFFFHTNDNRVISKTKDDKQVVIFGDFFNSLEDNIDKEKTVSKILDFSTLKEVLDFSDELAGRFILIYKRSGETYFIPDAVSSIPINYSLEEDLISSHPQKIAEILNLQNSATAVKIMAKSKLVTLPNDLTPYENIKFLLPNHYYKLESKKPVRFTSTLPKFTYEEIIKNSILRINNTLKQITSSYSIVLPLTGGKDSRTILAFLLNNYNFKSYTYQHPYMGLEHPDISIPHKLAEEFRFQHNILKDIEPTNHEISRYKNMLGLYFNKSGIVNGLTLKKFNNENAIFLDGNIIPLVKAKFGKTLPEFLGTPLFLNTKTYSYSILNKREIKKWYKSAKLYSLDSGISIYDLMFWEMRTARWGGVSRINYDLLNDSINPFNCRAMILEWLSIPRKERYNKSFHKILIEALNKDLLNIPFDSDGTNIFDLPFFYYFSTIIHHFFSSLKNHSS